MSSNSSIYDNSTVQKNHNLLLRNKSKGAIACKGHFLCVKDQGSTAKNQGPTIKLHAVELLEHTHTPSHMIKIEIAHVVKLNERNPTFQKWKKFVDGALSYCLKKTCNHQKLWIWRWCDVFRIAFYFASQ